MRKAVPIICIILAAMILPVIASTCAPSREKQPDEALRYRSFRDIPGVTPDEINAIEALREQTVSFVYGMNQSTEAFIHCLENDRIAGFAPLFCEWLTELFGIPFQVELFEWGDLLAGMANGTIDFTGELSATKERQKSYFMTDAIIQRSVVSIRIPGARPLSEIAQSRPLRYAFLDGATSYDEVSLVVREPFEAVFVNDYEAVYNMLAKGEIDAFCDDNNAEASFDGYGDTVAEAFYPPIFGMISLSTQNPAFKPIISIVNKALKNNGVRYLSELYNQGYHEYREHKLFMHLSEEEQEYIQDNPVVLIAAEYDNYPISFYNAREKQWQGIVFDALDEIGALTGLSFEVVNDQNADWPALLNMLEAGKASMISDLVRTEARESRFLWPETSLLTDQYALLSKADHRDISFNDILHMRVGLTKDSAYAEIFRNWFPNYVNTIEYENPNAAFRALDQGKVDMVMAGQNRLLHLTHFQELTGYKTNVVFNYPFESAFGFNKNETILCSIIDKTLDKSLNLIDIDGIAGNWTRKTYDFKSRLVQAQLPGLIGAMSLLVCVLILLVILFQRNRREGKEFEYLASQRTEELEFQTATLSTILNSVPDLIFCKDLDLRYTRCNKSFEQYFGINEADIFGKKDKECLGLPAEATDRNSEWDLKVISDECRIYTTDEVIPCVDGTKQFFETIRIPLIQNGVIIGLVGISRNITHRKAIEEEALVASATKSAFLANMSHEIRTPMNSIIGFSELALDDEISPKTKEYLSKILENSDWLLQIINDILDISKIESGRMELESIPFDLHELLFVHCQSIIMPKAIEKGIALYFNTEPLPGKKLIGDPTRLRQIFINFLSNAVKFTNVGMVKASTYVKSSMDNYSTILFEIADSGIGMTPEQINRIFEPFLQGDSSTTRKYGGTGLGLPITKRIIEAMGGKLSVESIPGVGSKFSFELTFNTIDVSADMPDHTLAIEQIERPSFEGEVLICEDNHMNQLVICDHLARVGLKGTVVENGKKGVDTVQNRVKNGEKPFDLIFMDIHMPVMDGLEAATRINHLNTGTPIVAMTADLMSEDIEFYKVSGMNDCMGKPFTSQELWRCLLKYLKPAQRVSIKEQLAQEDIKLHKLLQTDFLKCNYKKYHEITEAIGDDDIKLAHRLLHTLKSNAGLIGKYKLEQVAADMEHLLSGGENLLTETHLSLLETELKAVLKELALEVLEQLEPLLSSGNPECLTLIDVLYTIPKSGDLIQQLEDFDFKPALSTLVELQRTLEAS